MTENYLIKHFNDLTTLELYELLRLRNEVFIVEQQCPYLDPDNKDQKSYHLLYYVDDHFAGYTRLLGKKLMEVSIEGCYQIFGNSNIRISAQHHLQKFYRSLGFQDEGEPYDEDGILHIEMLKIY